MGLVPFTVKDGSTAPHKVRDIVNILRVSEIREKGVRPLSEHKSQIV